MEVDTETGKVKLRKYVCVDDVGNQINPMIVEGQVHGGVARASRRRCTRASSTTRTATCSRPASPTT